MILCFFVLCPCSFAWAGWLGWLFKVWPEALVFIDAFAFIIYGQVEVKKGEDDIITFRLMRRF